VRPEVSALDFSNAVQLNGFRIPALSTRRTETEVELNDGQTFAIAGLLNNTMNSTMQKIPGIGDIPSWPALPGHAWKDQTELVVMITPHILKRDSVASPGPAEPRARPRAAQNLLPPPHAPKRGPAAHRACG
jgi:pilus assembly protein CpaC